MERATLKALQRAYYSVNHTYFHGALRQPPLSLVDLGAELARYVTAPRGIELSRRLVFEHPWGVTLEVLKHEMAHQYVHEHLGDPDGAPHGPAFREVCRLHGFDARAAGVPTGTEQTPEAERTLERIAKLLALAESPNEHEAQAAMNQARRLMLKYNLTEIAQETRATHHARHLGKPTGRVSEAERVLSALLSAHFFVDAIWVSVWRPQEGKPGSVLEVMGTVANLEIAAYVYDFLLHTGEQLWKAHRRAHQIRGDRDRRAFVAGVMYGFQAKLEAEQRRAATEGLVWVGDPALQGFAKRRHPRVRFTRHVTTQHREAHQAGHRAGQRIVLHQGVTQGSSGARPKLLKS
ncbi:MAG: DUF2786 domain-containing protein [Polyangiaceae bacterium]|nr:DUF2786 domain-containing protein [Polyangiaceae bacterium]